ncbi:xanthine dehydrogenase subunit D [Fodinicola feengrottensis]|uniref:Xanthine dehydrogenase subunit D n=1 Tax=Fodinicola feengrottensis TaxID=435914 RepID=A0ABN2IQL8_9ACTN
MTRTAPDVRIAGGVGESPLRPDGVPKVRGEFAYSSDLFADDMLWGATLRSPHPYARITSIEIAGALAIPGVHAVLIHSDVPGPNRYGQEHQDQPVLAEDIVRYQGEAVAVVAADHPETARRAAKAIAVEYEVLTPIDDAVKAMEPGSAQLHEHAPRNIVRHVPVRFGDSSATAPVVVSGDYEVGMQDQAFLGPESGLAVPAEDGGVDLYIATQWLHVDQRQVTEALGLPTEKVRLSLAGVGGAFGGREDLSIQIHACMLALHTGRPVKMVYTREESFFGHVHRHPAVMHYEHGAELDGTLVYVKARIVLDGGAYAATTSAVTGNAATLGVGPYEVPNVVMDAYGMYTNNPPCGAMRGFGAVQACFAYETQMDKLAAELGLDPVELRIRNAVSEGSVLPTGQRIDAPAPVARLLELVRDRPLPAVSVGPGSMPGGYANTTHGESVVRGVGYGIGIKNVGFSEGFDDYSTARVRLRITAGEPVVSVHTAAAEVGQGLVTLQGQIARTELGIERVVIEPADTSIGSAGSSSASRQSYVTGGAVQAACQQLRDDLFSLVRKRFGSELNDLSISGGKVVSARRGGLVDLVELVGDRTLEKEVQWRHRPTQPIHPRTGQGFAHVQYSFAAHRAVVDVDTELGLVKVVELACAQDVGKIMNPTALLGQIHGGSAQGLGLAVMEEIQLAGGKLLNPSFTDYLIPTILDMPPMKVDVLELADPHAPYGLRGVGEAPTISSTPAIVAAIRAATGVALTRIPVRPEHLAFAHA